MKENNQNKIMKDASELMSDIDAITEQSVSQLTKGIEKLTGEAKDRLIGAATTVKEEVGHGLTQYNTKAQQLAEKVPGGLGKKAAQYPWVAVTVGLGLGLILGGMLKPHRRF